MSNFTITKITAIVAIDPADGDEGIIGFESAGQWHPMVCADETRLAQMLRIAEDLCSHAKRPYRVIQFSTREDVTDQAKAKYLK